MTNMKRKDYYRQYLDIEEKIKELQYRARSLRAFSPALKDLHEEIKRLDFRAYLHKVKLGILETGEYSKKERSEILSKWFVEGSGWNLGDTALEKTKIGKIRNRDKI